MLHNGDKSHGIIGVIDVTDIMVQVLVIELLLVFVYIFCAFYICKDLQLCISVYDS